MLLPCTIFGCKRVIDAERLHRFDRGGPVGRGDRIGDRELHELAGLQRRFAIGHVDHPAPQHELADRVGEQAVGDGEPAVDRRLRAVGIGRQEHLERRAMGDLGEERSRRAEDQHRLVARLLFEQSRDLFRRLGEIGGDSDMGLPRLRRRGEAKRKARQAQSRARSASRMMFSPCFRGTRQPLYAVIHTARSMSRQSPKWGNA